MNVRELDMDVTNRIDIFEEDFIKAGVMEKFTVNDIEMKIDTVIEYNGAPLNSQYKIPFDANSELSDGTITTADVQKLMENIVYSRIMDNHVQFYGTVSDLSAICSSSSSSSSCDFIAYMKLA